MLKKKLYKLAVLIITLSLSIPAASFGATGTGVTSTQASKLTRSQFITMVNEEFGFTETTSISFLDVPAGSVYYQEVQKAVKAGYISGVSATAFAPFRLVTREQASVMLTKILKLDKYESGAYVFSDSVKISLVYKGYIGAAVKAGLLKGYPDGTFKPLNPITATEAEAILSRAKSFVQATINSAVTAVEKTERTKQLSDYYTAKSKVDALSSETLEKAGLLDRLAAIRPYCTEQTNTFDFNNIKYILLDKNTTIKSLHNVQEKLLLSENILDEAGDDLDEAIYDLDRVIDALPNTAPVIVLSDTQKANLTDEMEILYNGLNGLITDVYKSNKSSLESTRDSLEDNLKTLDRQQSDLGITKDKLLIQSQTAEDQIVFAAEKLILGYYGLGLQEKKMVENRISLNQKLEILQINKSLGLATDSDIRKIQLNIDILDYTQKTVSSQKINLLRQLNLLIGEPYDDNAVVVFDAALINKVDISAISEYSGQKTAIANNYNIKLQQCEVDLYEKYLDRAEDDYDDDSDQYASAKLDLTNAEMKYTDVVRSEELNYIMAYDALMDKEDALNIQKSTLANEKVNLDTAKLKYKLGLISQKALADAESNYRLQVVSVEIAKSDLFSAYIKYSWVLKGLTGQ